MSQNKFFSLWAASRNIPFFRPFAFRAVSLSLCLLSLSFLNSCNKDEEEDFKSFMKIRGTEYMLNYGIYEVMGFKSANTNTVCLFLYSGFTDVTLDWGTPTLKGVGNGVVFFLKCPEGDLSTHDYVPSLSQNPYTCYDIVFFTNASATTGTYSLVGESLNDGLGLISVSKEGGTYSITFQFNAYVENWNGTLNEEITVTGQYKGVIPMTGQHQ